MSAELDRAVDEAKRNSRYPEDIDRVVIEARLAASREIGQSAAEYRAKVEPILAALGKSIRYDERGHYFIIPTQVGLQPYGGIEAKRWLESVAR
jgi:hypothetical protein